MNCRRRRQTFDLSAHPALVVICLGMRVIAWYGIKTLLGLSPQISNAVDQKPDGLLHDYDDVPVPLGFGQFAPLRPARGPMFSARSRAKLAGESPAAVITEAETSVVDR